MITREYAEGTGKLRLVLVSSISGVQRMLRKAGTVCSLHWLKGVELPQRDIQRAFLMSPRLTFLLPTPNRIHQKHV